MFPQNTGAPTRDRFRPPAGNYTHHRRAIHIDPHLQVHRSLARPILIITNLHTTGDRLNVADINWMGLFDRQSQGIQDGKSPTKPTIS